MLSVPMVSVCVCVCKMATVSKCVVFKGVPVEVVEGDLLVTKWDSWLSFLLGWFNDDMSHVTNATVVDGALVCVSPCPFEFVDASGKRWPAGIDPRPMELLNDPSCTMLWLVRPPQPRTPEQNVVTRMLCAQQIAENAKNGSRYESGASEFVASFCGWAQATTTKFHCAEFSACLRRSAGLWPARETVSVTVPHLVSVVGGTCKRIF